MGYNPKDFYFKKAKEQNFAARSIFKLEEIDQRFRILRPQMKVLDLGCAPGSWAQYASQKIGPKGRCIGIDLQRVKIALPNCRFIQGDAFEQPLLDSILSEEGIDQFDIIMSDMAPKTTGVRLQDQARSYQLCVRAHDVAQRNLKPGGTLIVKFFQSDWFEDFVKELRPHFKKIELLRPKSTRKNSFEIFILGLDYQPNTNATPAESV